MVWDPATTTNLTNEQWVQVRELTDRNAAKIRFGLDLYIEKPGEKDRLHRQAYFRGLFGFQHDEKTPKGFVELKI